LSPWWRQQAQNESKPTRQRLLLLFLFFTCSICIAPYFLWAAFEEISAGKTRGGSLRSCRGPCVHFICCQRRLDLETLAHEASREGRPICPVGSCLSGFRAAQTSRRDPKKDRAPPPARREPCRSRSVFLRFSCQRALRSRIPRPSGALPRLSRHPPIVLGRIPFGERPGDNPLRPVPHPRSGATAHPNLVSSTPRGIPSLACPPPDGEYGDRRTSYHAHLWEYIFPRRESSEIAGECSIPHVARFFPQLEQQFSPGESLAKSRLETPMRALDSPDGNSHSMHIAKSRPASLSGHGQRPPGGR